MEASTAVVEQVMVEVVTVEEVIVEKVMVVAGSSDEGDGEKVYSGSRLQ